MSQLQAPALKVPSAEDPIFAEIVRRLVAAYQPERIYLFGSVARGDAGRDSDYDFMVVVPDEAPAEQRDCHLAYKILQGVGIAKDVLVWTRTEFEKRLHLKASLPSTILREGKLLYSG